MIKGRTYSATLQRELNVEAAKAAPGPREELEIELDRAPTREIPILLIVLAVMAVALLLLVPYLILVGRLYQYF